MNNVKISVIPYSGWTNCIEISNGIVNAVVTTDVGPRIIRFGFCDQENEFCEYADQVGRTGGDEWNIFGGHRLWHSPEAHPRSYHPDNASVEWKEIDNGICLLQPTESWAQIQKELHFALAPDSASATVVHRLTNKGAWPIELAAWALSVMAPGGKAIVPHPKGNPKALLPNRVLTLWPYTNMNDERIYWGEKFSILSQDTSATNPFKLGLSVEDGWAAYANHGHLFVKYFSYQRGAKYPDFGASAEVYTNECMLELETLSPLVCLEPGESIEHEEQWVLLDNVKAPSCDEDVLKDIIPLIKL
jgi:hypothetical protein